MTLSEIALRLEQAGQYGIAAELRANPYCASESPPPATPTSPSPTPEPDPSWKEVKADQKAAAKKRFPFGE